VTASAEIAEAKQSYDFLVPRQALPQGWNGYGAATLNMSYELDFWGKNRAALAAAVSEQRAAEVEIAQTRLILSTSVASAYAGLLHLYTLRDNAAAFQCDGDGAGEVLPALTRRGQHLHARRHRQNLSIAHDVLVEGIRLRHGLAIDERIGQKNAIAALGARP
jgi:hypothetical protein